MSDINSKYVEFIKDYADDVRYPVTADNDDMELAMSALAELESIRDAYLMRPNGLGVYCNALRLFSETLYCKAFEAGREAERLERSIED